MLEIDLDTADSATIAPVWAALLTGNAEAQDGNKGIICVDASAAKQD